MEATSSSHPVESNYRRAMSRGPPNLDDGRLRTHGPARARARLRGATAQPAGERQSERAQSEVSAAAAGGIGEAGVAAAARVREGGHGSSSSTRRPRSGHHNSRRRRQQNSLSGGLVGGVPFGTQMSAALFERQLGGR